MPAPSTTPPSLAAQARTWVTERLAPALWATATAAYLRWRTWYDDATTLRARRARAAAGLALAVTVPVLLAILAVWLLSAAVGELVRAALALYRGPVGQAAHDLAATLGHPAGAWLHQHAAHLPASPVLLGWAWLLLAVVLYVSARRGSLAGRLALAGLAVSTAAAVWQAGPAGSRAAAVVVTVGAWLLLVPSAYAETEKPPRRQEIHLDGSFAAVVVQQLVAAQLTANQAAPVPHQRTDGGHQGAPAGKTATPRPAVGFACRYCSAALVWDGPPNEDRSWRAAGDGGTYCPKAPALDTELTVVGHAHMAV